MFSRPVFIVAIVVAAVVVMGVVGTAGYLFVDRVIGDEKGSGSSAAAEPSVSVFLCLKTSTSSSCRGRDATEQEKQLIKKRLQELPQVKAVEYESQQQAYERFKKTFADRKELVDQVRPENLPDSFRLRVGTADDAKAVKQAMTGFPGVDTVQIASRPRA